MEEKKDEKDFKELKEELSELFEARKFLKIKEIITSMNEVDTAELLESIDEEMAVMIFRLIPKEQAAEVFAYMEHDLQESIITTITDSELHNIINELFLDDTVDLLEEMPANAVNRILKHTDSKTRQAINRLLKYPEDSAGSLMNTEFLDFKKEMTVREAFSRIRQQGDDVEDFSNFYVTDKNRILEGTVTIKDMLLAGDEVLIGDIMDEKVIYATTLEDKEEVGSMFSKYDLSAMPVVDNEKRLVGIITVDDAVEVIQDEATEDFELMAAVTPSEDSYMKTGAVRQFLNRIPWLLLLMLSATFTGAIIDSFEERLANISFLIAFIPMLMDTGGNCGSQASILVIRSLALGDIKGSEVLKVWWKEIRVALLCGIVLSVVNFIRVFVMKYYFSGGEYALHTAFSIAFTVSLALLITVIVAKSIGCLLPIAAKKIGFDPAIMASPLITTVVDCFSLLVYFNVAQAVFRV